jgi:hypothetical protein
VPPTRPLLAAVAIGAALVTAGCANEADPLADFLAEAHASGGTEGMTDGQVVLSGRSVCDLSELAPQDAEATFGEAPGPFVEVALRHCDDLRKPLTPEQVQRYQLNDPGVGEAGPGEPPAAPTPARVALGERFDVLDDSGTVMGSVAITDIEVDPSCQDAQRYSSTPPTPQNGHFIAVHMDVQTSASYRPDTFTYPTGHDFSVTGPDGYTVGQVYADDLCIADREGFGTPMQPNSKYRGWILIDSPVPDGSLTFRPHFNMTWPGVTIDLP